MLVSLTFYMKTKEKFAFPFAFVEHLLFLVTKLDVTQQYIYIFYKMSSECEAKIWLISGWIILVIYLYEQ